MAEVAVDGESYNGTMTDYIDPSQLRPGPIRHASLPPELLEPIRAVYEIVGPFLNTTLEQFEITFVQHRRCVSRVPRETPQQ